MTNSKTTKRALLTSILALITCLVMLLGTTFAWFTDSVTSGRNQIVAGNLDVELEYSTDMSVWNKVDTETNIFDDEALWEPGYTEVVYLRVSNVGSLALKYTLGINIASETIGKTKDGNDIKLSDYIEYGVVENVTAKYADRSDARSAVGTASKLNAVFEEEYSLAGKTATATDTDTFALIAYMPETVGNEANHNGTNIPVINLGLSVLATQDTVEEDSFDDQYDKNAIFYDALVTNADELYNAVAAASGDVIIAVDGNIILTKALSKAGLSSIKFVAMGDDATIDQATYNMYFSGAKVTFDGLTLTHGEKKYGDGGQASTAFAVWNASEVNYIDCIFNRSVGTLHASLHNFIGCTFNGVYNPDNAISEYPLYICHGQDYNVVDCVFNCTNKGAILFYNDGGTGTDTLNISNTYFLGDIIADKTAVEIHNNATSQVYNVNIKDVVVGEGIVNGLYRIKPANVGTVNVNVDGDSVVTGAKSVGTADELKALSNNSLTGTIVLTDDIDLGGADFTTIAAAYGKDLTVIGNGCTISNAKITAGKNNGMDNYGMFYAYTNSNLVINDLVIEGITVEATGSNYGAAVLVGYMDGGSNVTMNNVTVKNSSVKNAYNEAAVFVGYQTGTLTLNNCSSEGCSVEGETAVKTGAFIGHCNGTSATLNNCTTDLTIGACNRSNGTLVIK